MRLRTGPRPMDVLDRCRAFRLPSLSTQHTNQVNKAPRRAYRMGPGANGKRRTDARTPPAVRGPRAEEANERREEID